MWGMFVCSGPIVQFEQGLSALSRPSWRRCRPSSLGARLWSRGLLLEAPKSSCSASSSGLSGMHGKPVREDFRGCSSGAHAEHISRLVAPHHSQAQSRRLGKVDAEERQLVTSPRRPRVLAPGLRGRAHEQHREGIRGAHAHRGSLNVYEYTGCRDLFTPMFATLKHSSPTSGAPSSLHP
jgi:hypothetical protein